MRQCEEFKLVFAFCIAALVTLESPFSNTFRHYALFATPETSLCPGHRYSEHSWLQHLWEVLQEGELSNPLSIRAFQHFSQSLADFIYFICFYHRLCKLTIIFFMSLGLPAHVGFNERHNSGHGPCSPPSHFQGSAEDVWWYMSHVQYAQPRLCSCFRLTPVNSSRRLGSDCWFTLKAKQYFFLLLLRLKWPDFTRETKHYRTLEIHRFSTIMHRWAEWSLIDRQTTHFPLHYDLLLFYELTHFAEIWVHACNIQLWHS